MLALYEHKPFLNRLLLEASRTVLVCNIMVLHSRHDEADRATWPTLRLVAETMALQELASASRVQDLVSRLIKARYLEQRPAPQDRRVRILTPTRKMIEQDQDFLVSHYLPLGILYPDPGYPLITTRDPAFQIKHRQVSGELFALGAEILHRQSDHDVVPGSRRRRDDPHQDDRDGRTAKRRRAAEGLLCRPRQPLRRVTHPCKLLEAAEELDLVRLTKEGGQFVELLPPVLQAFDRLVAEAISGLDLCYQLALRLP
jgi:hypothetical protein